MEGLLSLVWKNEHWTQAIVDLKLCQTKKYHIEAMFLQLLAAQFISAEVIDKELRWTIGREDTMEKYPPFTCTNETNWLGIHLLPA